MTENDSCNALIDGYACGNETVGQNADRTKRYCWKHVPSGALPGLVRMENLEWSND